MYLSHERVTVLQKSVSDDIARLKPLCTFRLNDSELYADTARRLQILIKGETWFL